MSGVYGRAAGSLSNSESWLKDQSTVAAGARGERNTAAELNALSRLPGGPTVMHDLTMPRAGVKANIDHLVISGSKVTIIDSKLWKPGFYWTAFGHSYRGKSRFEPAEKKTLPMAVDILSQHLRVNGIRAVFATPLLVVWPSNDSKPLTLGLLRSPGARAIAGPLLAARLGSLVGTKPADPAIVAALRTLVHS